LCSPFSYLKFQLKTNNGTTIFSWTELRTQINIIVLRLLDTALRVIFRLVGEAFFKDWIVAVTHSSAKFEASS